MSKSFKKKFFVATVWLVIIIGLILVFLFPIRRTIAKNYLIKAESHYNQENWKLAEQNFEKSLYWDKGNGYLIYTKLAVSQYNLIEYDQSLANYVLALKSKQADQIFIWNNMGNVLRHKNQYAQAVSFYDLAIASIKSNPQKLFTSSPFYNKVGTLVYANKCQEAISARDEIIKNYPKNFTIADFSNILLPCELK